MSDRLLFVHFPHPGGEWDGRTRGRSPKGWTLAPNHGRKFMRLPGTMVGTSGAAKERTLGFWGEWEAPSHAHPVISPATEPRWIHEPYLTAAPRSGNPQNTDPFVFGGKFLYTVCRQYLGIRATQLQTMAAGSVVLFGSKGGSREDPTFVLDTVFVVSDEPPQWHDARTRPADLKMDVPPEYWPVTLDRLYGGRCGTSQSPEYRYRLYSGVEYRRGASIYSYFPAVDLEKHPQGFARPEIKLDGSINPKSWRSAHFERMTADHIQQIWDDVRQQVLKSAQLGVRAAMPLTR